MREIEGGGGRKTARAHCHCHVVDVMLSGVSPRHHHEWEKTRERGGGMSSGQGRR